MNGIESFYLKNVHGDVIGATDATGTLMQNNNYDAFGNRLIDNIDPFGYCGEYMDAETGHIYLRNRYYDTTLGRFITEDPIKSGLNWYLYCFANPVIFVDPFGLEYIVVSGGAYSENDEWPYEFIEPALKAINDYGALNDGENITWIIADSGWLDSDKKKFQEAIDLFSEFHSNKINIKYITDAEQLIDYINYKDGDNRMYDKIKKFVVFSHGFESGTLSLGFNYGNYNEDLNLYLSDITTDKIKTYDAFENPNSMFYSCNTGTGVNSFAQHWVNITGGKTWAYQGKTEYSYINNNQVWTIIVSRQLHGFSYYGSQNYPTASSTAFLRTFTKMGV